MSTRSDPRIFFAAERTLLAWQRGSLALMAFGFVIERFSLLLSLLHRAPADPNRDLLSLLAGVLLILLGSMAAFAASIAFRRFVRTLPSQDVPHRHGSAFGVLINLIIAAVGLALAGYILFGAL